MQDAPFVNIGKASTTWMSLHYQGEPYWSEMVITWLTMRLHCNV